MVWTAGRSGQKATDAKQDYEHCGDRQQQVCWVHNGLGPDLLGRPVDMGS